MRIGYPCLNRTVGCTPTKTFRLASYSEELLHATVSANLACLEKILQFNAAHGLLFFRITSDLVPFASHPVCRYDWQSRFSETFARLGQFCREHGFRISLHPDQFVLLNALDENVLDRSLRDLEYQCAILDLMGLDRAAKVQIHLGGVYGDREAAVGRFADRYVHLPRTIRDRLVIENDERLYPLSDCLAVHARTGIPVILDVFHHELLNNGETIPDALRAASATWKRRDGIPMVDYSTQQEQKRPGAHAESIQPALFSAFLEISRPCDFDLMLEIKDKEKSAIAALAIAAGDPRLVKRPF